MSNVDAAWLSMDDPTNLMMITGVMTFKQPIDLRPFPGRHPVSLAEIRPLLAACRAPAHARQQAPLGNGPKFDLAAHVHRIALPAPGDQAALQAMVSDLASTPLDPSKALWQAHRSRTTTRWLCAGCAHPSQYRRRPGPGLRLAVADRYDPGRALAAARLKTRKERKKAAAGPIRGIVHSVFEHRAPLMAGAATRLPAVLPERVEHRQGP